MKYYKGGDLYSYLEETMVILSWKDIVDMLWSISAGLNVIHEYGFSHGHLHGGNILVENEMDSIDAKITDTGLRRPFDSQKQIYGVVPFVAPEIFNGSMPTKASDIYSFGMIMWMLSAGMRPYHDRPHDKQLIRDICSGLRPSIVDGTPPVFSKLMLRCLDANPSNRPTSMQLHERFANWISDEQSNQFNVAEEIRIANLEKKLTNISPCHEDAIYLSRPLNSLIPL